MNFDEAKSVDDCIEMATVDAYDEYESITGWLTCLEEILLPCGKVKVLGQEMKLVALQESGGTIVAVCEKSKKRAKLTLDSIELIKSTEVQKLWLKAWSKWSR